MMFAHVLLLLISFFNIDSINGLRLQINRQQSFVMSSSNKLQAFQELQYQLMQKQVGKWIGIQAGYAVIDPAVADYMYCQENLSLTSDGSEILHTRSLVVGEIRADCEVCFDSERVKTRDLGTYSVGKLRSRLCENVELRGPGITPRGLSSEVTIRHEDRRVRILLAYSPIGYIDIESVGEIPNEYSLTDIIIVREKLNSRPLNDDNNPDYLWRKVSENIVDSLVIGEKYRCTAEGTVGVSPVDERTLVSPQDITSSSNEHQVKADYSDYDVYTRLFPGAVFVEARKVITTGEPTTCRFTWVPTCALDNPDSLAYAAEITYTARSEVSERAGGYIVLPPLLEDFSVDLLHPSVSL